MSAIVEACGFPSQEWTTKKIRKARLELVDSMDDGHPALLPKHMLVVMASPYLRFVDRVAAISTWCRNGPFPALQPQCTALCA